MASCERVWRTVPLSWPLFSTPSIMMLLERERWPLTLRPLPCPLVAWGVMPGTVRAKSVKLRPLEGRFSISCVEMVWPVVVRLVSTMGTSPADFDALLRAADLERERERGGLRDGERDAGIDEVVEAVPGDGEGVVADGDVGEAVATFGVADAGAGDVGGVIDEREFGAGDESSAGVVNVDFKAGGVRRLREGRWRGRRAERRQRRADGKIVRRNA